MSLLRQATYDVADGVKPLGFRETSNKIDRQALPGTIWDWEWLEDSKRGVSCRLCAPADLAVSDESLDVFPHCGPVVVFRKQFVRFCFAGVSHGWKVVVFLNESESEWCVVRDVDCVPVGQFPSIDIAVGKGDLG